MTKPDRYISFLLCFLFCLSFTSIHAQRCEKKKLAPKDWLGDFDYISQSTYTQLAVGDTIRMKTIVYSQYNYRIFVAGERRLGKINYRILIPEKRFEPTVDKVVDKQVVVYERDANGFLVYDENEDPIPKGNAVVKDTIWTRRLVTHENPIFENNTVDNFYWESKIQKTRLLVIEIIVPKSRRYYFGCIALMVGRIPFADKPDKPEGSF
jgi:hypothetical protein